MTCRRLAVVTPEAMDHLLIMGVAGSGKTTLGQAVAAELGWRFVDADDHHSPQARAKMAAGIGLNDADRQPWLASVSALLRTSQEPIVLACSALKAAYRRQLPVRHILFLDITPDLARQRLATRTGHFAGPALVTAQFDALEPPDDAWRLPGDWPPDQQLRAAIALLRADQAKS